MKLSRGIALSLLILAVASLAHGGGGDKEKAKDKFEGSWVAEIDGKKYQLTFAKDAYSIIRPGEETLKGTFKADASKKPKEMNLTINEGEDNLQGKDVLAIYEFVGETLRIVGNDPAIGNARPKEFPANEGGSDGYTYLIFKRAPK